MLSLPRVGTIFMCMGNFGKKVTPGSLVDGDRSKPPGAEGPGDRGSSGPQYRIRKRASAINAFTNLQVKSHLCSKTDNCPLVLCTDFIIS